MKAKTEATSANVRVKAQGVEEAKETLEQSEAVVTLVKMESSVERAFPGSDLILHREKAIGADERICGHSPRHRFMRQRPVTAVQGDGSWSRGMAGQIGSHMEPDLPS